MIPESKLMEVLSTVPKDWKPTCKIAEELEMTVRHASKFLVILKRMQLVEYKRRQFYRYLFGGCYIHSCEGLWRKI